MSVTPTQLSRLLVSNDIRADSIPSFTKVNGQPVSATLEIQSTTGTLLIPRMSQAQIDALPTVTDGMIVFNEDEDAFNFRAEGDWIPISTSTGDVTGPDTSTVNNIAVFDDDTGESIADSGVSINDVNLPAALLARRPARLLKALDTTKRLENIGYIQFNAEGGTYGGIYVGGQTPVEFYERELSSPTDVQVCSVFNGGLPGDGSSSPSALVEIKSSTGVLLLSQLTTNEINNLVSPQDGMLVYNKETGKFMMREAGFWVNIDNGDPGDGTVTSVATGTGLTGGPITTTGTISIADTGVTAGTYTYAGFTVNAQGQLTAASSGTSPVTSITAGSNLTGGTITSTGTIALSNTPSGLTSIGVGNFTISGSGITSSGVVSITSNAVNGNILLNPNGIGTVQTGNLALSGSNNTIYSTNPNGNIVLSPNGSGSVTIGNLSLNTNTISSTNTNGNIALTPNGTGSVTTGNLALNTNTISTTNTNGNLVLSPNGTGLLTTSNNFGLGAASAPNRFTITGTASSYSAGPHVQTYINGDSYPLFQVLSFAHNNVALFFDAYYNGSNDTSSNATSNFHIWKNTNLNFRCASGIAPGTGITFINAMVLTPTGNFGINDSNPACKFSVVGNAQIGFSSNTSGPTNGLGVNGRLGAGISNPSYPLHTFNSSTVDTDLAAFETSYTGSATNHTHVLLLKGTSGGYISGYKGSANYGIKLGYIDSGTKTEVINITNYLTGGNVGINKAPGAGIDLDVAGIVRAASFIGTGGTVDNVTVVTGSYTALTTDSVIAVNMTAPAVITLPSSPATGQTYKIVDYAGTAAANPISVIGNGKGVNDNTSSQFLTNLLTTLTGFSSPNGIAITPNGNYAYVVNYSNNTVMVIQNVSTSPTLLTTLSSGFSFNGPWAVAITPDGNHAYVVNRSNNTVTVIQNASSGSPALLTVLSSGFSFNEPIYIAITPDGNYAYVTNYGGGTGNTVTVIQNASIGSPAFLSTITVGGGGSQGPNGIAITPNGNRAYVANSLTSTVTVIQNVSTNSPTVLSTLSTGYSFNGPMGIAITPSGNYAYVTNASINTVTVIQNASIGSPAFLSTITVGSGPYSIAITPNGNYAYVTNFGVGSTNTVSVIQNASTSPTIIITLTVGTAPSRIAITPNGNYAYVVNYIGNSISVIQGSYPLITSNYGGAYLIYNGNQWNAEKFAQLAPPQSQSTSLVLGTAYYNPFGYDIVLNVYLLITANSSGSILSGVGPTTMPTQQTILSGVTTTGYFPVTLYIPANYYALLSTSGTITVSIVGQQATTV